MTDKFNGKNVYDVEKGEFIASTNEKLIGKTIGSQGVEDKKSTKDTDKALKSKDKKEDK